MVFNYLFICYLFVNGTEIHRFKAKDSQIAVAVLLYLGGILKDWSVDKMKKNQDLMDRFMTLVLIMMLLLFMIY